MLTSATLRRVRLLAFLLCGFLLLHLASGCRSAAPAAYQVQWAPPAAPALPAPPPTLARAPTRPVAVTPVAAPLRRRTGARLPHRAARPAATVASGPALRQAARPALRAAHRALVAKPDTTEVGLGTTVLGVLGLIVAPIALIGLLIWGGAVWAVLLGLAALAVLVAYIDPF